LMLPEVTERFLSNVMTFFPYADLDSRGNIFLYTMAASFTRGRDDAKDRDGPYPRRDRAY